MSRSLKRLLLDIWYSISLKKKLYVIIGSAGLVMLAAVISNKKTLDFYIDSIGTIMDDNLLCYKFQDAVHFENDSFSAYISDRTPENKAVCIEAAQETREVLDNLPFDYHQIGEERYLVTWNILNSYSEYEKQRDFFLEMKPSDTNYIQELYRTYSMQEYLSDYALRLTRMAFSESSNVYENLVPGLKKLPFILAVIGICSFLLILLILHFITGSLVRVLSKLAVISGQIERNDFSAPDIQWAGNDEIGKLVRAFNKMKRSTQENQVMARELHRKELERSELEQRFSFSQLQLIKSQLNPHFLFNTLNMITRMSQLEEAPVTEEMMVALSNLLRYSLRTSEPFTPLNQELKVVSDYVYIQKMRFGNRVRCSIDCPQELEKEEVPVFLLQPLVENAILHGISEKEEGGAVVVRIRKVGDRIWISVADTGMGIENEKLAEIRRKIKERNSGLGIGLGNIYRRISAYYEYGNVSIYSREGNGTAVQIEFGKRKER